jgi:hypothetical protein
VRIMLIKKFNSHELFCILSAYILARTVSALL